MGKFAMSLLTMGLAGEMKEEGVAVNALWPLTAIETSAVINLLTAPGTKAPTRTPEIMADASIAMLKKPASYTGQLEIDEVFLRRDLGYKTSDLKKYSAMENDDEITPDFFVPEWAWESVANSRRQDKAKAKL